MLLMVGKQILETNASKFRLNFKYQSKYKTNLFSNVTMLLFWRSPTCKRLKARVKQAFPEFINKNKWSDNIH